MPLIVVSQPDVHNNHICVYTRIHITHIYTMGHTRVSGHKTHIIYGIASVRVKAKGRQATPRCAPGTLLNQPECQFRKSKSTHGIGRGPGSIRISGRSVDLEIPRIGLVHNAHNRLCIMMGIDQ